MSIAEPWNVNPDELDRWVEATRGLQPWRRVFHAVNGLVLALVPGVLGLTPRTTGMILLVAFVVLLAGDVVRLRSSTLNVLFFRWFRTLASPRERTAIASSTWYTLGVALAYLFTPGHAVAATLTLGLADPAASVVGRAFGTREWGKGTMEGSITFAVVAWLILAWAVGGWVAPVVAAAVAAIEVARIGVDDNLTIPVAAGLLLQALGG